MRWSTEWRLGRNHNVDALFGVIPAVDPTHERTLDKADCGRPVGFVVFEPVGIGPNCVLQHGGTNVIPVDDVEVLGLEQFASLGIDGLQHQGVLVVDHGLSGIDIAIDQRRHVEVLLDQGDVATGVKIVGP